MEKHFFAGFVVGGLSALVLCGIRSRRSSRRPNTLKGKVEICDQEEILPKDVDETILREQLRRNYQFFGEEGQEKVRRSFVIVIGLGGVGSHCAHMLVRSGVEHVRLIDFDQVTLSSLNRHAVACQSDVGISKVECLKRHLLKTFPHANIEVVQEMFNRELADELLDGNPDYVIDCIDNIDTKVDLIFACKSRGLNIISAMGAGGRADPTRIQIGDISDTSEDPLSRSVRKRLKKMGVEQDVKVVYSSEKPRHKLLPLENHQQEDPDDYRPISNLRLRIMPVLGTIPAIMGDAIASYVLAHLAGQPLHCEATSRCNGEKFQTYFNRVKSREKKIFGAANEDFMVDPTDIAYLIKEVFRSRSVASGRTTNLTLTRWDKRFPASVKNLVLLTQGEAEAHDKLDGLDKVEPVLRQKVETLLAEVEYS